MNDVIIRQAKPEDAAMLAEMAHSLWPEASAHEHARDLASSLNGEPIGSMPETILVAHEPDGVIIGFVQVDLRSHADGCDPSRPVGFIEGWYVAPKNRRRGVGSHLVAAAEEWARSHGCKEMASDTWLNAFESQHAHQALGYEIVDRCIHYRKNL